MVDGTVTVTARCRWRYRCDGALVLFGDPEQLTPQGRIGAADLAISPGQGRPIRIKLTPGGRRSVQARRGVRAAAVIVLKWAQGAPDVSQRVSITP